MAERECTWCKYLKSLYRRDLEQEIEQYIRHLPEDVRTSDPIYEARLEVCSSCVDCIDGICKYCGCFVAARAAKDKMECPKPGKRKW